jgi:hypothetical protein
MLVVIVRLKSQRALLFEEEILDDDAGYRVDGIVVFGRH